MLGHCARPTREFTVDADLWPSRPLIACRGGWSVRTHAGDFAAPFVVAQTFYFKPESGKLMVCPFDQSISVPTDAQPEELDVAIAIARLEEVTGDAFAGALHKQMRRAGREPGALQMRRVLQIGLFCLGSLAAGPSARADDEALKNRGNDPFIKISTAIPGCPQALGPLMTEKEWRSEAHYRAERGNSCWLAGRCRLSNAYRYDAEIAESVQRRLTAMSPSSWQEKSTLWLTLQRRFIFVHGCVSADFDKKAFLAALAETADVDTVVDQIMVGTSASPVPYKLAAPAGAVAAPR